MKKSEFWILERAPEPTDILWENLKTSTFSRINRSFFSFIATIILIGASLGSIIGIKIWAA
jgi:hypothetical protein